MPASPKMSADEGSLTGAALGMSPPPSDNGALGDDLPSSFHPWWGPESCVWLLVEEPNDIALDPVEQWRRLSFLLEYGDYAARVWNCLLKASRALKSPIYKSVVQFRDNLTQELKDSSDETKKRIRLVERCVVYLINQGLDIDLEMVKLAILVYSKRNITCHARIGEISNSAALRREIERANRRLPEVLPSDQSRNYSAWQRILAFYGSSQDFINLNPALGLAVSCPSPTSEACPPTHGAAINERIPVTSRPVLGQTRTRHSVSDPLPYIPRKRRAVGSPDSDERNNGKPAASPFPTVAFGNVEDACTYQEIYRDIDYVFGKNQRSGRRALQEARKVVRQARANIAVKCTVSISRVVPVTTEAGTPSSTVSPFCSGTNVYLSRRVIVSSGFVSLSEYTSRTAFNFFF
ncbi:Beta-lactamase family protein [Aspergillus niger]|uniref:Beta-lactamase family protein n=1 Tax=Aspergillus niger TaxID=5061 RepID=A0A505I2H4_ASPNG|nr:Beta-lactamase family protein [Aspergillus niger]